jgi:uncharacterized membrane protein
MNCRWIGSVTVLGTMTALLMTAQRNTPSPKYTVYDLGPTGNLYSTGSDVNDWGVVVGSETVSENGVSQAHAALWYRDTLLDIKQLADERQPGLLGPNSAGGAINDSGLVLLGGETTSPDPNNENFCGYGTGLQCVAMLWSKGVLSVLPNPLGGTNTGVGWINGKGEVAGFAENSVRDPECLRASPNGTGPQVLDYEAIVWGPAPGQFRQLPPLRGDTVSLAEDINDVGQVVGVSGSCGNTVFSSGTAGPHAVLWEPDGTVHDLGNFGGTSNPSILGVGNAAIGINNEGVVVGTSAPPGDTVNQPFIWTRKNGMQHLPLLPGDVVGAGLDINNRGEVVGASISPGGIASGNPSAVVWHQGAEGPVTDLNEFLAPDSPFAVLLTAFGINDEGKIVGFGATTSGDVHAFVAFPCEGDESTTPNMRGRRVPIGLSPNVRVLISGRPGMAR